MRMRHTEAMNIQARTTPPPTGIDWESFGDVTHRTAATIYAERHTIISGIVETRRENSTVVHKHKVQRVTSWTAIELQQD